VNKVLDTYNTNEGWVVKKMKPKYVNRIVENLCNIYHKDKVQYFCNKFAMMRSWRIYQLGCNHAFSIGQRVDQMGKMLEEHG
jgi:hypothetical protein